MIKRLTNHGNLFTRTRLAVSVVSILLVSCASDNEPLGQPGYHSARAQATLEVPPDLVNSTTGNIKQPQAGAVDNTVLPDIEGLEIKGSGLSRYLSIGADAEKTWAKLLDFVSLQNFPILLESKREGILETDWIGDAAAQKGIMSKVRNLFSGSLGRARSNDKYKFWIERLDENTTAIRVEHNLLAQRVIEPKRSYETTVVRWEQTPGEEVEVVAMLRKLKSYFGGETVEADLPDVQLITDNDQEYIKLTQSFDQAWASVGQAIGETEYRIVETNQEKYLYLVKQSKAPGLISKLTYKRKWGIKVESFSETSTLVTATSAGGRSISREDALPILYALTEQLRKQ